MRLAARLSSLYSLTANYEINTNTLLNIYKTQVRPIWEYGCMFYANTKEKVRRLQVMQNKFLRLTFPTARSSSIDILHIVANIEMVEQRVWKNRVKLLNNFILSPSYHPLFQLRAQLYNQLVRPTKKYTYSLKGPISSTIVEVGKSEIHYGPATDFAWNLKCNLSLTARENAEREVNHPLYSKVTGIKHRGALQLHTKTEPARKPGKHIFLGEFKCDDEDDGVVIYGEHPRTALPNNWDNKITGFSFKPMIETEEEMKPVKPNSMTTVIYTDGSMEKMYAGAGACIKQGGKRKDAVGTQIPRHLYHPNVEPIRETNDWMTRHMGRILVNRESMEKVKGSITIIHNWTEEMKRINWDGKPNHNFLALERDTWITSAEIDDDPKKDLSKALRELKMERVERVTWKKRDDDTQDLILQVKDLFFESGWADTLQQHGIPLPMKF